MSFALHLVEPPRGAATSPSDVHAMVCSSSVSLPPPGFQGRPLFLTQSESATTLLDRPLNEWRYLPGFDSIFFGIIRPYPCAPLPRLPVIITLPSPCADCPAPVASNRAPPVLALPWHSPEQEPSAPDPAPPVQETVAPPARRRGRPPSRRSCTPPTERGSAAAVAPRARRERTATAPPSRASARIAAADMGSFIDMTTKAIARKALRECLAPCSEELKKQVVQRRLLKKKNPLKALDLTRLAKAAELDYPARRAVAVAAATSRYP